MNWYTLVKLSALPDDWWRDFQFHFSKVIENLFPQKVNFAHPTSSREPALCVGEWPTGASTSQFFRTSFGQKDLTFNFKVSCKNHIYNCSAKLNFNGYIAHHFGYRKGNVVTQSPVEANFIGATLGVYRKHTQTGRWKWVGVDDPDTAQTAFIKIPLDDSTPYVVINKIKQMVMSDNPDDGEGGDNSGSPSPTPAPSSHVPTGPLVGV